MVSANNIIGGLLVDTEIITPQQLKEAVTAQQTQGDKTIGEILVEKGWITEEQMMRALEYSFKIPFVTIDNVSIPGDLSKFLSHEAAKNNGIAVIAKNGDSLTVATSNPLNFKAIDDVKLETGLDVKTVLATPSNIQDTIVKLYEQSQTSEAVEQLNQEYTIDDVETLSDEINDNVNDAPVVKLVNLIISHAISAQASDIHIEPFENKVRIRFRIDGQMYERFSIAKSAHSAVVARIKIMGNMDIAEKRVPQDGRSRTVYNGKKIDLRLSVLPTVNGEKAVIRVLGGQGIVLKRKNLGFSNQSSEMIDKMLKSPNGIILVSGPTGSGKSTTLYTILGEVNRENVNVITVEDPVEFRMAGINQVQINTKMGLTFAAGLRSILRQDPDVIMIGEIRDAETAEIAVRASITGHQVFSTIHTNDAVSTISRLIDMGVEPYLVSASLVGVISQRLVRRICKECKEEITPTDNDLRLLGHDIEKVYKGRGCPVCNNTGYKGRIAIHEILIIDHEIRALIDKGATVEELRDFAIGHGMLTLRKSCENLVDQGITTIDELVRVTYSV